MTDTFVTTNDTAGTSATLDFMPQGTSDAFARPFTTLMWVEGRWTGDGRFVLPDAITWDGLLPMPLTVDHEGVEECIGRVDTIERVAGATAGERYVIGRGVIDLGGPAEDLAHTMMRLIEDRFCRGVSMELDAMVEGGVDPDTAPDDMPPGSGGWVTVVEAARCRALSVVTTAAFAECHITFDDMLDLENLPPALDGPEPKTADEMPDEEDMPMPDDIIIVAAAGHTITIPKVPPADWFRQPTDVDVKGALTITDEGRVYGWLAPGNVPYSGVAGNFTAPLGAVNYRDWMRGETVVDGGERVVTGNITMGCGHGDATTTDHAAVRDHYDNSCALFAKVAAGETADGVWVAGALYPGVTAEQVERAMGLSLSGHWLPSLTPGYRYDLLAALLVPVPGFAMARRAPSVTMRDGQLVASAVPVGFATGCGCGGGAAAAPTLADRMDAHAESLVASALAAYEARLATLEELTRPQRVEQLRARIAQAD